jgi:hypothetical protein
MGGMIVKISPKKHATAGINIIRKKIMREFLEIWQEEKPKIPELPWRAQLAGHIGQFPSREAAEKYVDNVRKYRAQEALRQQQQRD